MNAGCGAVCVAGCAAGWCGLCVAGVAVCGLVYGAVCVAVRVAACGIQVRCTHLELKTVKKSEGETHRGIEGEKRVHKRKSVRENIIL